MLKNLNIRLKLMIIGSLLTIVPLIAITVMTIVENKQMIKVAEEESTKLAFAELEDKVSMVYNIADTQHELLLQTLKSYLNITQEIVSNNGGISTGTQTVYWNTVNQYTKQITSVKLPTLLNGETWFGQTIKMGENVPVVDKVQALCGGVTSTVFQRINNTGDMLRVATNVLKQDGSRAIGTYIPQINPDGKPNPVVAAVLAGQTYTGRAFVVDKWYITAYAPIYDAKRQIIGALYVGIPIETTKKLRQDILDIKVGETGYAYVLESNGNYLISQHGKRDGDNILDAKDASGNYFIRNLLKKAMALNPGETGFISYPWKNQGDTEARIKDVKFMYFAPWDWIIGVGSYEEEVLAATRHIDESASRAAFILIAVTIVAFVAALLTWFFVSGTIAKPIVKASQIVRRIFVERDFTLNIP
nr:Cache 3/Cache 2 fusion domain-containing protein [Desulfobacterales bacterium]